MQFSKAGLELPDGDQPFKKRSMDNTYQKVEHDYDALHSNQTVTGYEPTQVKSEIVGNMSISAPSSEELFIRKSAGASPGTNDLPAKYVADKNPELSLTRCSCSDMETQKSKVHFSFDSLGLEIVSRSGNGF